MISKPQPTEHSEYYQSYLDLVDEDDLLPALQDQIAEFQQAFSVIPSEQLTVAHEPYTWTIKEALGHIIDNERVFGYRMMRFAAGDTAACQGYDQVVYIANSTYNDVKIPELVDELTHLRRGNLAMIKRFPESAFDNMGSCDGNKISVRAIVCLLIGHLRHHLNIIKKRAGFTS